MTQVNYNDIVTEGLLNGSIENRGFNGFFEDYNVLQCLLKIYKPKTFYEIGTCDGTGVKIIKNTLGQDSIVFSMDLPTELIHQSLRISGGDRVGKECNLPYIQLRGDSMIFDFSKYPCEGYFVDGAHTTEHVSHETKEILKLNPKIIIYHDANMPEVMAGIIDGIADNNEYNWFRVIDTRICYAVRKVL